MSDQTNAEVSDERLREIAEQSPEGRILRPKDAERSEVLAIATELLTGSSVTSQASEGAEEPVAYQWRYYHPDEEPSEWRVRQQIIRPVEAGEKTRGIEVRPLYASPSKRVERLEGALKPFADLGELMTDEDGWSDHDELNVEADSQFGSFATLKVAVFRAARQALQGGRS